MAVALEVFALDYGKHRMIGANSSVEINSRKLGESVHEHLYRFEVIHHLFIGWHNDQLHNGWFDDLTFFKGPADQCCSQIKPVNPSHWPFIFINHSDYGHFFSAIRVLKSVKTSTFRRRDDLERTVLFRRLCNKYNYHIRIVTCFRTNTKNISCKMFYS